ncbi:hypothetical protein A9Q84_00130 [Halobacteriovorax marinus]|uniref:Lipoprotein n=1 Tax=Halobacteriovorax marinus TaxID=97084 RepID=A0A1Y5FH47_9BACT|nr:hypothetical protein A9Q84_00130 [Halobacteriovorax marinus]
MIKTIVYFLIVGMCVSCATIEPNDYHVNYMYKKDKSAKIRYADNIIESLFVITPKAVAMKKINKHCNNNYKVISTGKSFESLNASTTMKYQYIEYECI